MMKTKETEQLERDIRNATRKMGVFGCFEVTIGLFGRERVDFMTYEARTGIFRCYEIKVTKSDFKSNATLSFVGHYNYYVLTEELYEQVKNAIPKGIGVYVGKKCMKKATRQNNPDNEEISIMRSIDGKSAKVTTVLRQVLMDSMIRSLYRDSDKLLRTGDEQYINRLQSKINKSMERERQIQSKYNYLYSKVAEKYGNDEAWNLANEKGEKCNDNRKSS